MIYFHSDYFSRIQSLILSKEVSVNDVLSHFMALISCKKKENSRKNTAHLLHAHFT